MTMNINDALTVTPRHQEARARPSSAAQTPDVQSRQDMISAYPASSSQGRVYGGRALRAASARIGFLRMVAIAAVTSEAWISSIVSSGETFATTLITMAGVMQPMIIATTCCMASGRASVNLGMPRSSKRILRVDCDMSFKSLLTVYMLWNRQIHFTGTRTPFYKNRTTARPPASTITRGSPPSLHVERSQFSTATLYTIISKSFSIFPDFHKKFLIFIFRRICPARRRGRGLFAPVLRQTLILLS